MLAWCALITLLVSGSRTCRTWQAKKILGYACSSSRTACSFTVRIFNRIYIDLSNQIILLPFQAHFESVKSRCRPSTQAVENLLSFELKLIPFLFDSLFPYKEKVNMVADSVTFF